MMEEYLAHSAKKNCPPQSYLNHIKGVCCRAVHFAKEAQEYQSKNDCSLTDIVRQSALLHDLGKLDKENQEVLRSTSDRKRKLPVNHADAGSAALMATENLYSALIVYSHHRGLPNMESEYIREHSMFRDQLEKVRNHVDQTLPELLSKHKSILSFDDRKEEAPFEEDQSVFFRMTLSCLADADHTDTAAAYNQVPPKEILPQLRAEERLASLDRYVANLAGDESERNRLRGEMYDACRNAETCYHFSVCDSPVGSGKTTAIMAHLLQQAVIRKSRHIFVILPYTSIIQHSVDIYRQALVLPGEESEEVVAELHCRADFQDKDTRYLTSLWRSPVIVTTAVSFFETLASNQPSTLRRFHELPGSVFFIDEAHNAIPLKLLPLAWKWMNVLADEWNCYWVMASGSLVRYWQLNGLNSIISCPDISELVDIKLREKLMQFEQNRISFRRKTEPINRYELISWIKSTPGPRLLILNTVQSAAVIANDLCTAYGRECVEHLSTALTPEDRSCEIKRVRERLNNETDTEWTLVATSCVEAGVDFSFRTGFRELSSLLSLLQASGRVNRHGLSSNAEMWTFTLQDNSMLKSNPAMNTSRRVLKKFFEDNVDITSELATRAMDNEIAQNDSCLRAIKELLDLEDALQFQMVSDLFKVIDSNTVPAIVDESSAKLIAYGKGNWQLLQKKSVSIPDQEVKAWKLKEITGKVYRWTLGYDSFLGYMRGVLDIKNSKEN